MKKAGFRKVKMGPDESHQFGVGRSGYTQSSPVGKDGMEVTDKGPSTRQQAPRAISDKAGKLFGRSGGHENE